MAGLIGLFSVPLLNFKHTSPLAAFYTEWFAAVCGLMISAALVRIPRNGKIQLPRTIFLFFGLIVLLIWQSERGVILYQGETRLAILYMGLTILVMGGCSELKQTIGLERLSILLGWVVLASGAINALIACLQAWDVHVGWLSMLIIQGVSQRPFGNLAQVNHFCAHQGLAFATLMYLMAHRRIPLFPGFALLGLLLTGLALSGSRSAWLYLTVFYVLSIMYRREMGGAEAYQLQRYTFWALPAFFLVQQGLELLEPTAITANTRITGYSGGVLGIRLAMWKDAWTAFMSAPLFGVGYQGLAWQHFLNLARTTNPLFSRYEDNHLENAHNIVFHLLAEFGIGGGVILILGGWWLYKYYKRFIIPERWLILAMLAVLIVHSFVEYPLHFMHFLAPAAVLLALAEISPLRFSVTKGVVPMVAGISILAGVAFLTMLFSNYRALEQVYSRSSNGKIVLDLQAQALLAKADRGGFFTPQVEDFINGIKVSVQEPAGWEPLLMASENRVRHQTKATYAYRHVLLLALNGKQQQAQHFLKLVLKAYPNSRLQFEQQISEMLKKEPSNIGLQMLVRQMTNV